MRKKRKNIANHKINEIFDLLHSLDIDTNKYEIIDDEFGKLRDEIAKVISENKIVTRKAEENEQVLREYTEDIAHQLKTPLTGMLLMVDLMEEDKENGKEYIKRIRYNIGRLYQLVDILLKFAALDSGTIQMKKEKVNMKDLIEDIITDVEIYFNNNNFVRKNLICFLNFFKFFFCRLCIRTDGCSEKKHTLLHIALIAAAVV